MTDRHARILITLLAIALGILVIAVLKLTYYVTMPLVAAFYVTVLVWPVYRGLEKRLPQRLWWVALVAAMLLIVLVLAVFVGGIWLTIQQVAGELMEEGMEPWEQRWEQLTAWLEQRGLPTPEEEAGALVERAGEWAAMAVQSMAGLVTVLLLILFFTLLMLLEAQRWRRKSQAAMSSDHAASVIDAVAATTHQVRRFVLVQAMVAFLTALVTWLWLWLMDLPLAFIWALLTFLLDFVPNVGPIAAGILVLVVALVMVGFGRAILITVGVLAIQQFFGNYVNPLLQGRQLSISPLVVLLSVIFWTWAWGAAGALLAVPIAATFIIGCAHVPAMRPIALMLSRTADREELMEQTTGGD